MYWVFTDFLINPVKSGFNTVRLHLGKNRNMFRVNPRVTLGRIIFTFLIGESEKEWKVPRDCLRNLPKGGPSGNQTFCLITLGTSIRQIFPLFVPKVSWTLLLVSKKWYLNISLYFSYKKIKQFEHKDLSTSTKDVVFITMFFFFF